MNRVIVVGRPGEYFAPRNDGWAHVLATGIELAIREKVLTPELVTAILGRPATLSDDGEAVLFI